MSDLHEHYQRRAALFVRRSERAREQDEDGSWRALLGLAAENLLRAAQTAPPAERETLLAQADEAMAVLAEQDGRAAQDEGGDRDGAASSWEVISNTGICLDDVAGLEEAKRLVYNMVVRPALDREGARRWRKRVGGGILLYGPPGTGKTFFARAVAGELDAVFLSVAGSQLLSKWVGDAEKNVDELFTEAAQHERCVLFLDEVESLLPARGSGSPVMDRVVPAFLAAMDGIAGRPEGLLLMGATNRPDIIDSAALRRNRFERQVYVGLPESEARAKILWNCLEGTPLADDVELVKLAEKLSGYSGADIASLCDEATSRAWDREECEGRRVTLSHDDLRFALRQIKPSVDPADLAKYEVFRKCL